MPTADSPKQKSLGQVSLLGPGGGGGGQGAAMIIEGIVAEQQRAAQKVMSGIQKMQAESAAQNDAMRTSLASGVQDTINKVVASQEKVEQQKLRTKERAEDKEFSVEMAEFQGQLQQDIQTEAQRVSQQIATQRQATMDYLGRYEDDRNTVRASMEEGHQRLEDMWSNGYFDQFSDGLERFIGMKDELDRADALSEDHFSDRNIADVYARLNGTIEEITSGGQAEDLMRSLRRDPLLIPYEGVGRKQGGSQKLDPETTFNLKMGNGYPGEGVIFGPSQPGGVEPKLFDPDTFKEVLFYDSYLTQMADSRNRRKLLDTLNRTTLEASQKLTPMMDMYRETNKLMGSVTPTAVKRGIQEFVSLNDSRKYNDPTRTMFAMCLKNVFPEKGEEMAELALKVFDGSEELNTTQDFYVAMGLESAAFNIREHLNPQMLQGVMSEDGKTKVSLAGSMVQELLNTVGPEQASSILGLDPSVDILEGPGLVAAQRAMTDTLTGVRAFADRVARGLHKESALEEFKRQYGKTIRMGDVLTMHKFLSDDENRDASERMLRESFASDVEGLSPGEADKIEVGPSPEYRQSINLLDSMLILAQDMGPDTLKEMAVVLSAGAEDISTPNLFGYQEGNRSGATRSPFSAAAQQKVGRRRQRQKDAKAKSVSQTYEERGAAGVAGRAAVAAPGVVGKAVGGAVEKGSTATGEALFGKDTLKSLGTGIHTLLNPLETRKRYQEAKAHNRRVKEQ